MVGCGGKVLFGLATGCDVVGSSRGRIGYTIVGTGFDGSFVPCAEASPTKMGKQKPTVRNSIDARIFRPLSALNAIRRTEFRRPASLPRTRNKPGNEAITQIGG